MPKEIVLVDVDNNPINIEQDTDGKFRLYIKGDVRGLGQKLAEEDKMFVSTLDFVTIGNTNENDVLLLRNPSASGIDARIRDFIAISSKASNPATLRIYKAPTITSDGTTLAANNLRDLSVASKVNVFKIPVISARGTLMQVFGLIGQTELRHEEMMQMFVLDGEDFLLTIEPNSPNQSFALDITWGEE